MVSVNNPAKTRIGFIGMGNMGLRMAERLLLAGYPLAVYDRTPLRAQEVTKQGAELFKTPRELASRCQVVMSCVTDDQAQQAVMFGPDGAFAGVRENSVVIDLSTVSPETSRHLYQKMKEKSVPVLDAAVSGSVPQVEQGKLVIFVGGDRQTFDQCKPLLEVLGKGFYMGDSGTGTTMKLVVNTLLGLGMQALAEAIAMGEKAGLPKGLLLEVLDQTAVLTPGQKAKLDNVKAGEYPAAFALSLMQKDFALVLGQAYDGSVAMPATAAAEQMYTAAMARGLGHADFSVMIKYMEEVAGV
jgi:3-hydroxyisobutyrate dehydrogenase-like beta-hydroxyacid dehydrogenase